MENVISLLSDDDGDVDSNDKKRSSFCDDYSVATYKKQSTLSVAAASVAKTIPPSKTVSSLLQKLYNDEPSSDEDDDDIDGMLAKIAAKSHESFRESVKEFTCNDNDVDYGESDNSDDEKYDILEDLPKRRKFQNNITKITSKVDQNSSQNASILKHTDNQVSQVDLSLDTDDDNDSDDGSDIIGSAPTFKRASNPYRKSATQSASIINSSFANNENSDDDNNTDTLSKKIISKVLKNQKTSHHMTLNTTSRKKASATATTTTKSRSSTLTSAKTNNDRSTLSPSDNSVLSNNTSSIAVAGSSKPPAKRKTKVLPKIWLRVDHQLCTDDFISQTNLQNAVQERLTGAEARVQTTYDRLWGLGKIIEWCLQNSEEGQSQNQRPQSQGSSSLSDPAAQIILEPIDDVVVIVWKDPHEFLQLLYSSSDDVDQNDYPILALWVKTFLANWHRYHPNRQQKMPRFYFLLHNVKETLDQIWVQYRRGRGSNNTNHTPPTTDVLQDAIFLLLLQYQIECIYCKDVDRIQYELNKITRLLLNRPSAHKVLDAIQSSLKCVAKLKPQCELDDAPAIRANDTWTRQVSQIPRCSKTMALYLTQDQHFPTIQSVWQVYQDDSINEEDKPGMLAHAFRPNKQQHLLSQCMYQLLTSDDPQKLL